MIVAGVLLALAGGVMVLSVPPRLYETGMFDWLFLSAALMSGCGASLVLDGLVN